MNIAGFDFGCGTDGSDNITAAYPPLSALGGPDGAVSLSRNKRISVSGLYHEIRLLGASGSGIFLKGKSNY